MQFGYLVVYALVTCLITIRSYIKKYNPIYCALWTEFAVSAVFCVIVKVYQVAMLGNGLMQSIWYDLSDTTLKAYILLIICNVIAFEPLREFDAGNQFQDFGKNRKMQNFFVMYSVMYLVLAGFFILTSLGTISAAMHNTDYGTLRASLANAENEQSAAVAGNAIANICYKLCFQFKSLSLFVAFGSFKEKCNRILSSLLLIVTFFVVYISNAVLAGRGSFLIFTFSCFLIGLCFYKYLSKATRRKVVIGGVIILGFVLSYFFAVTISRVVVSGRGTMSYQLIGNAAFYLGHGPIEFSKITGSLDHFGHGRVIIARFISHYFETNYSWPAVANEIGYPAIGAVYNTYLGYLYADFGSIGCIIYTSLWSYLVYQVMKRRPLNISSLFLFGYYLHYYVTGNFVIGRMEYVRVVTTIIIYLLIRVIERSSATRRFFTAKLVFGKRSLQHIDKQNINNVIE